MRILLIVLTAFLGLSFTLFSFNKSKFSDEPELFIEELKEYMKNVTDSHEEVVERFVEAWENDSMFSDEAKADIIKLSQKLDVKNARPFPHFVYFLDCMIIFEEQNVNPETYAQWVKGLEYYLKKKKANSGEISSILKFSVQLFEEGVLYESKSTKWMVSSDSYKINPKKGLIIEFDQTDLVCYTRADSINLYQTKGSVDPAESIWTGDGGLVTWERGGYSREQVNAKLKEYTINLKKSEYSADNVVFTNTVYLEESISGDLQDKVRHISKPEDAIYPQFFSYEKTFQIENLYEGINYSGGLSMQGAKLVGRGTTEEPAKIYLFRKDTLVLEATSLYFGFKSERVSSQKTGISIKLKQDSIYHPDLSFSFRTADRELTLLKSESFTSQGPYYNSYHKIDMNFDRLVWRIDEDYMNFTAPRGASISKAYFESENFFNYTKFIDLQLMDNVHPLISLRSFTKYFSSEYFPIQAYADYLNMPLTPVKHLVMRMAYGGFVFYDDNTGFVQIKPRLHDYLAASVNKIDYDVMGFSSSVEAPQSNAIFNLQNYDLVINGIPKIFVSDSQNVAIVPKNAQVILKENRNFSFDGTVNAGLLNFYGEDMFFHYDSFKINLTSVDSVSLDFLTGKLDNFGLPEVAKVNSSIQKVTGEILIDKADNKSGRVSHPEYPIFRSTDSSYVYFESPSTEGGVYESESFYFAVDTFTMDSLDNYNAYSMAFKGEFVSGGILPDIKKELTLQSDRSLGFIHESSEAGIPIYDGKATFTNDINLSASGLRGRGVLKYLTSTVWSEDIHFYPDSMNTKADRYEIARQSYDTLYPQVEAEAVDIHFEPFNDVMWAEKKNEEFTVISDSITLKGVLKLEPSGLSGNGRMDLKNSDLLSENFKYTDTDIYADTSDFYLKSTQNDGFTVLTENVNSHISYSKRQGIFKSNEDFSLVTFPENKYISYIDYFIWDMDEKTLAMGANDTPEAPDYTDEDLEPIGPRFISTDPAQHSLSFVSPLAYYDYDKNYINATGVKFIEVADARIYPKGGLITVQPNFKIKRLIDSWVRANKTSKFHTLLSAAINIESRKSYTGLANYDYVDENGDVQLIHFKNVGVDENGQTIASGELKSTADFTLSPVFNYQGKVNLFADDSLLTFKGATKIEHNCEDIIESEWLNFESRIDPNDIYIPIDEVAKDIDMAKIYSGSFMYFDSVHVYPTFLSKRKNYSDNQMVLSKGYLHYSKGSNLYKIGSKEKIKNFNLSENYISFNREDCRLYSEGEVQLGHDLGLVTLETYGAVTHKANEKTTEMELAMGIDFHIADDMIKLAGREIDSFPGLPAVDLNKPMYKKVMNAWLGEEGSAKFHEELNLFGEVKSLPDEIKHTILLSEINLVWNSATKSYHSVGKIGVASINGIQINKYIEGFFELRIKRSGDVMDLYLQLDRRNYYYFGYTRGIMQTLSSNKEYVNTILNMKEKDRKLKTTRGQTPYSFLISTDKKKDIFYSRWQNHLNNRALDYGQDELKPSDYLPEIAP